MVGSVETSYDGQMRQIGQDEDNGSSDNDDSVTMTRYVDDCGERIPSQLRGSVVVIVTQKDIMMYITILYCCTPIGDVFPSFWDITIVYGH